MNQRLSRSIKNLPLVSVLLCTTSTGQVKPPEKPQDWRAVAKQDIEAVYQSSLANHPGLHDPLNPKFGDSLIAAQKRALTYANQFDSASGYQFSLAAFRAKLNDGHAGVTTSVPVEWLTTLRWPGFVTAWRTDGLFVARSAIDKIAVGSKIVGCDGQTMDQIIKTNVFGFRLGVDQPGQWWGQASRVFLDEGNPFVRLPARCEFETNGTKASLEINWQDAPSELAQWRRAAAFGESMRTGITAPAPGVVWIALPTFSPSEEEVKELVALYKSVSSKTSAHLKAQAIVVDLRGNQGGSSTWSRRLAYALWGKVETEAHLDYLYRNVKILWRTSEDNQAALTEFIPQLKKTGDQQSIALIEKIISKMTKARGENQSLMPETNAKKNATIKKPVKALTFANKKAIPFFVIVDGNCASACLDAVDVFKLYGKTVLIGSPTASDSTYMEVRLDPLPSALGSTIIPMKIWVDRPRANGQFYTPDIVINDLAWSTKGLLAAIQDKLDVAR
jgi:hypothetical protein